MNRRTYLSVRIAALALTVGACTWTETKTAPTPQGYQTLTLTPVGGAVAPTPAATMNVAYPNITPTPQTVTTCGGIQTAIDSASRPAIIKILHTLDCTQGSPWMLRNKAGTGVIIITTDDATLPAPGTRVAPSDASKMPKLRASGTNNTIGMENGAAH
jgi:hypothetical protein